MKILLFLLCMSLVVYASESTFMPNWPRVDYNPEIHTSLQAHVLYCAANKAVGFNVETSRYALMAFVARGQNFFSCQEFERTVTFYAADSVEALEEKMRKFLIHKPAVKFCIPTNTR